MTTFNNNQSTVNYSPCKGCKERKENCHSNCPHYFAYKLEIEMVKQEKENEKNCKNYFKF